MIEVFFILGLTILMGFLSLLILEKTKISQIIVLMAFGFLLGPVMGIVDVSQSSIVVSLLPFLSTLALIVLLFDSGLMIDVFSVAKAIPKSTIFTVSVFVLTVLGAGIAGHLVLGYSILEGVLFGAVLGGTCSAIVGSTLEHSNVTKNTKSMLILESTMTDAFCIIVAVLAIGLISTNHIPDLPTIANTILSSFSIAMLIGIVSAIAWIYANSNLGLEKYSYMLTLALVFGLYAGVELVKANGGVAIFTFGMVLGNAKELGKLLRLRKEVVINPTIRLFQEEITFFVRTFFFAYIGLLITPQYFDLRIIGIGLGLIGVFFIIRKGVQKLLLKELSKTDKNVVSTLMPRGLAAAVLATMPITNGIRINEFEQMIFAVIFLSNIAATIGIFVFDKKEDQEVVDPQKDLQKTIEEADKGKEELVNKETQIKQIIKEET